VFLRRWLPGSLLVLCAACGAGAPVSDDQARDDFGTAVVATSGAPPERIVSLSPSTTELLFAMGAGSSLVGRTTWDLWPAAARDVPDLGPGLRPNIEAIMSVRPDLVVLYASEDNRGAAQRLSAAGVTVLAFRTDRIADFRRAAVLLGRATGREQEAGQMVDSVMHTLERVRASTASLQHPTVYWHLWDNPLITIGAGSFMHELVEIAGGRNIYAHASAPSPQVSLEDVARRNPDIVLAGPVGRERILADPRWQVVAAVRQGEVRVVDTTLVARTSVRLGEAAISLARLLHGLELQ
jgi:iron complex transport system substrate-binding protein